MIVFILPNFSGGGAERVIINMIDDLYQKKVNVGIVVFNNDGPLSSKVPKGVPIYDLKTNTLRRSVWSLVGKLRSLNPKMIFSTFGYINIVLLSLRLALPSKIKILIREANLPSISLPNNQYPFLIHIGYRLIYRTANKIFCTSQRMIDEFIHDFNLPRSKLHLLPNTVNDKIIRSSLDSMPSYSNNVVNFVAMGRLTHQKGFDRLLKWFSQLNNKQSVLRIIGSGPLESDLKHLTKKLNLSNRVVFCGYLDNPWEKIAASDVFLLPSRWEGMSNAALEALACGTPIIATSESGGVAELNIDINKKPVVVTSTADEFIREMENIIPMNIQSPRASLLPPIYSVENSIFMEFLS